MPKTKQATEQAARLKIYIPQLDVLEERLLEWTEKWAVLSRNICPNTTAAEEKIYSFGIF